MSTSSLFLIGLGVTVLVSLAMVVYIRKPLHSILVELCGTRERADFWAAVSHVTLVLVPLIFALLYVPEAQANSVVLGLAGQLKWSLIGLFAAVMTLAWILSRFIARLPQPAARNAADLA